MKKDEVGKSDKLYEIENVFRLLSVGYATWTYSHDNFYKALLRLCLRPLVHDLSYRRDELSEDSWAFFCRVREEVFDNEV